MRRCIVGGTHVFFLFVVLVGCTQKTETTSGAEPATDSAAKALLQSKGCMACHSINGNPGIGPTLLGLYGKQRPLTDGRTVEADEAYIRESILQPNAKIVKPYPAAMPVVPLTDEEVDTLVAFIKQLK